MPRQRRNARRSYARDRRRTNPNAHALAPATTAPTPLSPPHRDPRPPMVPYRPPSALLRLSPAIIESLQTSLNLLHLLHTRNRNQHRRSQTFYRPFRLLLRELRGLLQHDLAPEAKSINRKRAVKTRVSFWVEAGLVGKWYQAFVGLTQRESVRFAGVGLAGLGVLGSVMGVVGVTEHLARVGEREEEGEVVRVLERFAGEQRGYDGKDVHLEVPSETNGSARINADDDVGEVVSREGD